LAKYKYQSLILYSFLTLLPLLNADHIYDYMDALCKKDLHPRQLNTLDLPQYYPGAQPQPLIVPRGDFNRDGNPDLAISGIFDLSISSYSYFLLVATLDKSTSRPKSLFFETYAKPPLLFELGTTGEGDPKDQAFSLSFCTGCAQGWDFYWNEPHRNFDLRPWTVKQIRHTSLVSIQGQVVPQADVDQALQIVGKLPDVIAFVAGLKKSGRTLGTRVEPVPQKEGQKQYRVLLYEKRKGKEIRYDIIDVDLNREAIIKREAGKTVK